MDAIANPDDDEEEQKEVTRAVDGVEEDEVKPVQEIESLCMNCEKNVSIYSYTAHVRPAKSILVRS